MTAAAAFYPVAPLRLRLQAKARVAVDQKQAFLNVVSEQQARAMALNLVSPVSYSSGKKDKDGKHTKPTWQRNLAPADREWLAGVTIGWARMSEHLLGGSDLG